MGRFYCSFENRAKGDLSNPFKNGESHFNGIIAKQLEQKK